MAGAIIFIRFHPGDHRRFLKNSCRCLARQERLAAGDDIMHCLESSERAKSSSGGVRPVVNGTKQTKQTKTKP